ncbi:hypothetical protein [Neptuniibacter sp. QD37_11]|uniref:hypothetical protein n=1 Tax=Neptuniibacter sp. QD37_11 TaxID=3398209 RepID=UPI0039F52D1D
MAERKTSLNWYLDTVKAKICIEVEGSQSIYLKETSLFALEDSVKRGKCTIEELDVLDILQMRLEFKKFEAYQEFLSDPMALALHQLLGKETAIIRVLDESSVPHAAVIENEVDDEYLDVSGPHTLLQYAPPLQEHKGLELDMLAVTPEKLAKIFCPLGVPMHEIEDALRFIKRHRVLKNFKAV